MPILSPYFIGPQATANSCWASAGRSITNWYWSIACAGPTPRFDTDQAFADAWAQATDDPEHADIDIQQSAAAALADLGFDNNTDGRALPTPREIYDAINIGEPLLAIVADTLPVPSPNLNVSQGHWVVIIGISTDALDATLNVFDPDDGKVHTVPYDTTTYRHATPHQPGAYWQNTSYVSQYSVYRETEDTVTQAPSAASTPAAADADTVSASPASLAPASAPAPTSTPAAAAMPSPDAPIAWTGQARGGVTFAVTCEPLAGGERVDVTIEQTSGQKRGRRQHVTLGYGPGVASHGIWQFGDDAAPFELSLTLSRGSTSNTAHLRASYPATPTIAARPIVASWPIGPSLA